VLVGVPARLGAGTDRYSFTAVDLHRILLAGLPAFVTVIRETCEWLVEGRMFAAPTDDSVILINVFTVEPKDQQRLIDILISATGGSVNREPGFISATLHRSLDGTKVAMYAKWKDAGAYAAMRERPGRPLLAQALQIGKFEPGMYEVVQTFLPSNSVEPVVTSKD
jgi:quinol monooxygenase YgiN